MHFSLNNDDEGADDEPIDLSNFVRIKVPMEGILATVRDLTAGLDQARNQAVALVSPKTLMDSPLLGAVTSFNADLLSTQDRIMEMAVPFLGAKSGLLAAAEEAATRQSEQFAALRDTLTLPGVGVASLPAQTVLSMPSDPTPSIRESVRALDRIHEDAARQANEQREATLEGPRQLKELRAELAAQHQREIERDRQQSAHNKRSSLKSTVAIIVAIATLIVSAAGVAWELSSSHTTLTPPSIQQPFLIHHGA